MKRGLLMLGLLASSASMAAPPPQRWLMMVATACNDPSREAEFNRWYDDIDIPDVLEVPGYLRARRGVVADAVVPAKDPLPQIGHYVALYDVESPAVDKTIIDILMAARRMDARGRSTPLIQVTERAWYRQSSPALQGSARIAGAQDYLFVERVDCCADARQQRRFESWYAQEHLKRTLKMPGVRSATRFELYRILMIDPQAGSKHLTLYEAQAADAAAAQALADSIRRELSAGAPQDEWTTRRSILFRVMKDVPRPASR